MSQQIVGMSGAVSRERRSGKVVATCACVAVDDGLDENGACIRYMRSNQILVRNMPCQKDFGEMGDSGAVAYILPAPPPIGSYPEGTAIGLYWRRSLQGDLHVLAPLVDVLAAIKAGPSKLDLHLWP